MFGNNVVYRSPTRHLRVQGLQILLMGEVNVTSASQTLGVILEYLEDSCNTTKKKNNVILLKQELKKIIWQLWITFLMRMPFQRMVRALPVYIIMETWGNFGLIIMRVGWPRNAQIHDDHESSDLYCNLDSTCLNINNSSIKVV